MKFFNLLKKELAEIINKQMIISLVIVCSLLMILGNVMSDTISKATKEIYTITLCDRDKTDFTAELISALRSGGSTVNEVTSSSEDYAEILAEAKKDNLVIIPKGFTDALEKNEAPELISISAMKSASVISNASNTNQGAEAFISKCVASAFAKHAGISQEEFDLIISPVKITENTVVKDKSAQISVDEVMGNIMVKNMILPVIIFCLIMMTAQALISSVSNEKIDKTLETLLSVPVSRTAIITSKMLAAAIAAMINAVCFMFGFSKMMTGAMSDVADNLSGAMVTEYIPVDTALKQLGLTISTADYLLIGIQLFLTIMICLLISLVLGALVSDSKQAQTMIMPLMFGAMIPYLISMLADINSLPVAVRIFVYAIPFTHTFSAITNVMFGHTTIFFAGIVYQFAVFIVCMIIAVRIFKSDKILTMSLNIGQKSKFRKSSKEK